MLRSLSLALSQCTEIFSLKKRPKQKINNKLTKFLLLTFSFLRTQINSLSFAFLFTKKYVRDRDITFELSRFFNPFHVSVYTVWARSKRMQRKLVIVEPASLSYRWASIRSICHCALRHLQCLDVDTVQTKSFSSAIITTPNDSPAKKMKIVMHNTSVMHGDVQHTLVSTKVSILSF